MAASEASTTNQPAFVQKLYQAFFSPPRYEAKPRDQAVLEQGNNYRLPFAGGELAVTTWGDAGPAVLLMHGWGGARAQMTGLVQPLVQAGFRVVAYDQPGHGESSGRMTNLLEIAPSMDVIAPPGQTFDAILAHSFGTLITSYALVQRHYPLPGRLVYFGALNRLMDSLPRFQAMAKLPDDAIAALRSRLYENFGQAVLEAITNERLAPHIDVPALMFHDTADDVTPIQDSRAIAQSWTQARLIETTGLGHRGGLQSGAIQAQIVDFLKN